MNGPRAAPLTGRCLSSDRLTRVLQTVTRGHALCVPDPHFPVGYTIASGIQDGLLLGQEHDVRTDGWCSITERHLLAGCSSSNWRPPLHMEYSGIRGTFYQSNIILLMMPVPQFESTETTLRPWGHFSIVLHVHSKTLILNVLHVNDDDNVCHYYLFSIIVWMPTGYISD